MNHRVVPADVPSTIRELHSVDKQSYDLEQHLERLGQLLEWNDHDLTSRKSSREEARSHAGGLQFCYVALFLSWRAFYSLQNTQIIWIVSPYVWARNKILPHKGKYLSFFGFIWVNQNHSLEVLHYWVSLQKTSLLARPQLLCAFSPPKFLHRFTPAIMRNRSVMDARPGGRRTEPDSNQSEWHLTMEQRPESTMKVFQSQIGGWTSLGWENSDAVFQKEDHAKLPVFKNSIQQWSW